MSTKLIIMESPNKVRPIVGYLGPEFDVEASVRHIRGLPQPSELPVTMKEDPYGKFAVDVGDDFTPYYITNPDKKKTVAQLEKAFKEADKLYLATDDDRENEAIVWHLQQALKPKVPVRRMVFTEITCEVATRALDNTRELDIRLIDAQETRYALDRLVGYEVSPVLWRKVRAGLSAGHVQSVAIRSIAEREHEHMAFRSAPCQGAEAIFSTVLSTVDATVRQGTSFTARLVILDGRRMVIGHDFNDDDQLRPAALKAPAVHLHQVGVTAVIKATGRGGPRVVGMEDKSYRHRPVAPFTTSTLQQEASHRLRVNPRETMYVVQGLYENDFVTYIRADLMVLSSQVVAAARSQVIEFYRAEYVPGRPRVYVFKPKDAQEVHEVIRPTGDHSRTPAQVSGKLTGTQFCLCELIWKRTVTSQMADIVSSTVAVAVEVPLIPVAGESRDSGPTLSTAGLMMSDTVITFRGLLVAYEGGHDAERCQGDTGAVTRDSRGVRLPAMIAGQELAALGAEASGHEAMLPPHYTKVFLVKALEEREIGRPSVYATTMSTISDRGYVDHCDQALVPTWLAFAITWLLEENFAELIDYDFAISVERDPDRIAAGKEGQIIWLRRFYNGQDGAGTEQAAQVVSNELEVAATTLHARGFKGLVDNLDEIDARAVSSIETGEGITPRAGRYGPYLKDAEDKRASVPVDLAPDELTVDKVRELFTRATDDGRELGVDPASGHVIIAEDDHYDPYVTEVLPELEETAGAETARAVKTVKSIKAKKTTKAARVAEPHTANLLHSMDLSIVTLEQALDLLSLPRAVDQGPELGEDIIAQNGRYGPYLRRSADSRSLETEEQIFTITLEQALEIFAQPRRCRGQVATRGPLHELGRDPATKKPVVIRDSRFDPYITDEQANVTAPRSEDPITVSAERAFELLADKHAKGPTKKCTTHKTISRKATTRETTAKKTATTKRTTTQMATSKAAASKEG